MPNAYRVQVYMRRCAHGLGEDPIKVDARYLCDGSQIIGRNVLRIVRLHIVLRYAYSSGFFAEKRLRVAAISVPAEQMQNALAKQVVSAQTFLGLL